MCGALRAKGPSTRSHPLVSLFSCAGIITQVQPLKDKAAEAALDSQQKFSLSCFKTMKMKDG